MQERNRIDYFSDVQCVWAWINDGRHILYGNVGYRIMAANIEELCNSPVVEASWCRVP